MVFITTSPILAPSVDHEVVDVPLTTRCVPSTERVAAKLTPHISNRAMDSSIHDDFLNMSILSKKLKISFYT